MTVLVLGATGSTGRRVARQLGERGVPYRGASRHGEVHFDWADPASWPAALSGASAVYLMAPHEVPVEPGFVEQAVKAGVERLVLLSTGDPEVVDPRLLAAEELVKESGLQWTVLRPHWFNQNFDEGFFQPAIVAGELAIPLGDQRQAFVDAEDIAAVAVEALTTEGHHGQTYHLTGPDALTFAEAVEIIAIELSRPIRFLGTPDQFRATSQAPADETEALIAFYTAQLARGDATPTPTVETITGRPPIPFPHYAQTAAQTPAWHP